jgi:hypothetical protein
MSFTREDGNLTLRVQGGVELRRLAEDLRTAGRKDLTAMMRRNIRAAGRPVMADLRTAIMSTQVTTNRGGHVRPDTDTHLRQRIADALTVSNTRNGIRIVVSARRVGPYGASLPKYLDATIKTYVRWRHKVFGREDVWVEQRGQPWFFNTINRHSTDFRKAVLAAVDEIARILKG